MYVRTVECRIVIDIYLFILADIAFIKVLIDQKEIATLLLILCIYVNLYKNISNCIYTTVY